MVCLCECVKKVNYCVNESEWYVVTCLFEIKLHNWNLMCCHEFDEWFADVDTCILFSTSLCDVYLYKIQSLELWLCLVSFYWPRNSTETLEISVVVPG